MKNCLFLGIVFLVGGANSYAQLVKTGKDESSIFAKTINFGFDVKEAEVALNFSNYSTSITHPSGWIYGASARSKNSEGMSSVFKNGHFTPDSKLSAVVGFFTSNSASTTEDVRPENAEELVKILTAEILEQTNQIVTGSLMADPEKVQFKQLVSDALSLAAGALPVLIINLETEANNAARSTYFRTAAATLRVNIVTDANYIQLSDIQAAIAADANEIQTLQAGAYRKHLVYLHGGLNNQEFTIFRGWDSTNLSNSFQDVSINGGHGGIGYNGRFGGNLLFGVRYTYTEGSNASELSSLKYAYSEVKKGNSQEYAIKKEIVAKAGENHKVYLHQANIDLCYFTEVHDDKYAILDLYYTGILSNNDHIYSSRSTIGLAASLYKENSNFIGGAYIELPDMDQNVENHKPTPNPRPWHNRLSFGVYGKVNIERLGNLVRQF